MKFHFSFRRWLQKKAYPEFECLQCVGQEYWQGCYCDYYDAIAPGVGPTKKHLVLRWLYRALFKR